MAPTKEGLAQTERTPIKVSYYVGYYCMTKCIIVFADWFSGRADFVIGHIMLLDVPFHKCENNEW